MAGKAAQQRVFGDEAKIAVGGRAASTQGHQGMEPQPRGSERGGAGGGRQRWGVCGSHDFKNQAPFGSLSSSSVLGTHEELLIFVNLSTRVSSCIFLLPSQCPEPAPRPQGKGSLLVLLGVLGDLSPFFP